MSTSNDEARGAVTLIAHRGVPTRAPENSAASFRSALSAGAAVVELDVRATRGDGLVVLHDETPARVCGIAKPAEETPAEDLVAQRYLSDPRECLLLLDEALAILVGRTRINIEIKMNAGVAPEGMARRVLEALSRAGSPQEIIVSSACTDVLSVLAEHAPRLDRALVYRASDRRDPVEEAARCRAGTLVANKSRIHPEMAEQVRAAGLTLWTYVVNDAGEARRLSALGCEGLITDDLPELARTLDSGRESSTRDRRGDKKNSGHRSPKILVIDLGSSSIKAALVSPKHGITEIRRVATPTMRDGKGLYEHDPLEIERAVAGLIGRISTDADHAPVAAAFAAQRSTGLWCDAQNLDPFTPAPSWRDARGEAVVAAMEDSRAEVEAIACLPLAPAWTALQGAALAADHDLPPHACLVPLASWLVARLTRTAPAVDPTFANRMFLIDGRTGRWSPKLLAAFGLDEKRLPLLKPTVADWGFLTWPGSREHIPLHAVIGDQQAAYIGAAGPLGRRLVLNIGTGTFAMRSGSAGEQIPEGARRAPLWTSAAQPWNERRLIEIPVIAGDGVASRSDRPASTADDSARILARAIALGDARPGLYVERVAEALSALAGPRDRSVLLAGGGAQSPHLRHLLGKKLHHLPIPHPSSEITILGAARLAAAAASLPWSAT